jgi:PmbA protein
MASLTDNRPFDLPGPAEYAPVATADPAILSSPSTVADQVTQELLLTLQNETAVRLSSAEVFVEDSQITQHNSAGATGSKRSTDVVLEMVLLASGKHDEMESNTMVRCRRAADLNVASVAHRHAQYARDALTARTPRTGTFPVVISDEALAELLMGDGDSPLVLRSSAQAKYQQISPWELGQSVLPEPIRGDPIVIYSNSLLDYGTRSGSFDHEGHPGQRTLIVDNGILRAFWGPIRYAQYLGIASTGEFGNLELQAGSRPYSELLQDQGPYYHIVSFSAMSPDPITGDFVGEIRLGYEVTNGIASPIRGGSISGNLFASLATARLSSETVLLAGYSGPRAARFESITVAGA